MSDPNRPPLSSAAQAVMDAYSAIQWQPGEGHHVQRIAAALRAAADQCADGAAHWELYAIAAELEGADQPTRLTH